MPNGQTEEGNTKESVAAGGITRPPAISLPKGGGAIRGIDEKFSVNPATGTSSLTVPIFTTPGRSDFYPKLSLSYDSGAGNGPFGVGWNLSIPSITRKTDKGIPRYQDAEESDTFILSGAEDLVPSLRETDGEWIRDTLDDVEVGGEIYTVQRYRPRIEGLFARIERWQHQETGDTFWKSISRDNVTSIYGKSPDTRIFDPEDESRVFKWLLEATYDDKGNAILYEYIPENAEGIDPSLPQEKNRLSNGTGFANKYLKRIHYGNREPYKRDEESSQPVLNGDKLFEDCGWLFEVVFDYGEHDLDNPGVDENQQLPCRLDPFSAYRAGFEIRTYRLCRRVLMFHHFPEESIGQNCLVRSTDFTYDGDPVSTYEDYARVGNPVATYLESVTQTGYVRDNDEAPYTATSLPPLEFSYTKPEIDEEIRFVDAESLENLPNGLDGSRYRWVDLDGEGVSDILTQQADAWFYKRNLGEARFAPVELLATKPSLAHLQGGQQQFVDLAGDGQLDLVQFVDPVPGFYERSGDQGWNTFRAFRFSPNVDWNDPNLRLIDLNGDGHADILVSEDEAFVWYPSRGEQGFGPAETVRKLVDEEEGPTLVFADATQSVYLADLSGDGLIDIARIRNGDICYWPNLGYGRFGSKVTMDKAPFFDHPNLFDQKRIRLADIDGSGTTDIIYLDADCITIWFNQAGNSWSPPRYMKSFPRTDNLSSVAILDFLGNGTGCIVWSSPLPGDSHQPMRYMDLMGGVKPHLLKSTRNNMGAETRMTYAPSTKFYLEDLTAGKPWITRLPFPVHVLERVETYDWISKNRFVTRYAYHHGYYDSTEREFRGFGMVEQWDTEEIGTTQADDSSSKATNLEEASYVPPVLTRTWFHTGAYIKREKISRQFEAEYFREPGQTDKQFEAMLLPDTVLPEEITLPDITGMPRELSSKEIQEACRALKGSILRLEVYAQDDSEKSEIPYTVSERSYEIKWLQPQETNQHAVFFAHPCETIDYHYERMLFKSDPNDPDSPEKFDPRVSHQLNLEVDIFGNVFKSAAVGYGRRLLDANLEEDDREKQRQTLITYTENRFTNAIDQDDAFRTPLPCETLTYELTGLELGSKVRFSCTNISDVVTSAEEIPYEATVNNSTQQKRPIEHVRTLYRNDNLSGPLALSEVGTMALPFESYNLVFTPGLLNDIFIESGKISAADLDNVLANDGTYLLSDGQWWIPSGQVFYSPEEETPGQELAYAREHFFLPHRVRDPFEQTTKVQYDNYNLLLVRTTDPLGNVITVETEDDQGNDIKALDYRVMQPWLVVDPNDNRSAIAFDTLGMVVGTAVMGKQSETQTKGDSLEDFNPDLSDQEIKDHIDNPFSAPHAILQHATTRIVYDVWRFHRSREENPDDEEKWQPIVVYSLARETHHADLEPDQSTTIQHSFLYSDGFGREIQTKIQAEPGDAPQREDNSVDPDNKPGPLILENGEPVPAPTEHRWVGTGRTIYNNKGKPVKQYEPFFSSTHLYEEEPEMVMTGVTPIIFYDPLGRVVATLHPNHTYEKVIFDPWRQETWDVNDTVLQADPKEDPDVGDFFRRLPEAEYLPTWHELRTDTDMALLRWPDTDPVSGDPIPENANIRKAEKSAAEKAAAHANTPSVAYFDTLGRIFLTIADNGLAEDGTEQKYPTRVELDIEGNQREVIDTVIDPVTRTDRVVMRYDYDMLGNQIHQASMEAGERWILNDVAGNPIYGWDSRGHVIETRYDELRRPTEILVQGIEDFPANHKVLVEEIIYGESQGSTNNHRGRIYQQHDAAGIITNVEYDFKGNLVESSRQLTEQYKTQIDWSAPPVLTETFASHTRYDALNRPIQLIAPHSDQTETKLNIIQPLYNEANLLEQVHAWLNQDAEPIDVLSPDTANLHPVANIDYDAKGQRTFIEYGNGTRTGYEYDPETFRLTYLLTKRNAASFPDDCPSPPLTDWPGCDIQNLHYTYDPVGNITGIRDDAQQTIFFRNQRVEPSAEYTYDALYRLIKATGREHLGQTGGQPNPPTAPDAFNHFHTCRDHPGNGKAMGTYIEEYVYDAVGNFLSIHHRGNDPAHPGWTRTYDYNETSQLEAGKSNNRLSSTTIGSATYNYGYDGLAGSHGNITSMPHLTLMQWDYKDQLQSTSRQKVNDPDCTAETTYYVYDASGQRVRKVIECYAAAGQTARRSHERIYLGGFEIYREYNGDGVTVITKRETLHIMDDQQRIALVETKTVEDGSEVLKPKALVRFQLNNHLGSSSLELDESARVVSYEEYYSYGSTSYQAVDQEIKAAAKRYRYTGKERDDETGLYYYGARYYAAWLGRWVSCDPIGISSNVNLYDFTHSNPIRFIDPQGTDAIERRDELRRNIHRGKREKYINQIPQEADIRKNYPGTYCPQNMKCGSPIDKAQLMFGHESKEVIGFYSRGGDWIHYYNRKGQLLGSELHELPLVPTMFPWEYISIFRSITQMGSGLIKKGIQKAKGLTSTGRMNAASESVRMLSHEETLSRQGLSELSQGGGKVGSPVPRGPHRHSHTPGIQEAHPFGSGLGSTDPTTVPMPSRLNQSFHPRWENLARKSYSEGFGGRVGYKIYGTGAGAPTHLIWRWSPNDVKGWAVDLVVDLTAGSPGFLGSALDTMWKQLLRVR